QSAAEIRTDLKRLKRDTSSGRVAAPEGAQPHGRGTQESPRIKRIGLRYPMVFAGATMTLVLCLLVVAFRTGWLSRKLPGPQPELRRQQLTANPVDDPVFTAAISPDGKYLAFTDRHGVNLRVIDTGETHSLPLPAGFCFR